MVPLPVEIADHGRYAVGVANKQGADEHQHIHDDGDGGYAVLPYIPEHCQIEQQGGDAGHQRRRQLRKPVGGGVKQHAPPKDRLLEMKQAVLSAEHQKIGRAHV